MPTVAYRAVRSRRKFVKAPQIKKRLGAEMDKVVKPHLKGKFEKVVADWDHKVDFQARKYITSDSIKIIIFPTGPNKQIWMWVTLGTKPHDIVAVNAPFLAFQLGYQPRTRPVGKYGGPGKATGAHVKAKAVRHPGTAPRLFELAIRLAAMPWYSRTMENAWRRVLRAV